MKVDRLKRQELPDVGERVPSKGGGGLAGVCEVQAHPLACRLKEPLHRPIIVSVEPPPSLTYGMFSTIILSSG